MNLGLSRKIKQYYELWTIVSSSNSCWQGLVCESLPWKMLKGNIAEVRLN